MDREKAIKYMHDLLRSMVEKDGSDLFITAGAVPSIKVDGEMTLSTWGRLVWGECKASLLSKTLLNFPRLVFEESFKQDYKNTKHPTDKRQLQETLATVSCLLEENRGDSVKLKKDGGLHYTNLHTLEQGKPIGHFRVNYSKRVTCLAKDGVLYLRRYGEHDVIDNP